MAETLKTIKTGGQATFSIIQSKVRQADSISELINDLTNQTENNSTSPKTIITTFSKHGVYLDTKENELISRRFLTPTGNISVSRLLKSLDIGIPSDYKDLDQFQDQLPQPYRMIAKILELEIIDRAWLEILRKYPEVQEEIPGRNVIIRRNKNLDIECFPSAQSERSQNIAAMNGIGNIIFTINVSSSFSILDNETGKTIHTLQLFPEETQEPEYLQYSITTSSVIIPTLFACRVAVMKIKILPKPPVEPEPEESEKEKKAKAVAAANAMKKTSITKGKPNLTPTTEIEKKPAVPTHRCSVALIDVLGISSSSSSPSSSSLQCNFVYSFDFNLLDSQIFTEFSTDGRCLIVSHGTNISFFKFPPINSSGELFGKRMGKILENENDMNEEHETKSSQLQSSSSEENKVTEPQSEWNIPEILLKQSSQIEKIQLNKIFEKTNSETTTHHTSSESSKLDAPTLSTIPRITFCHLFSFGSEFQWDDPSINNNSSSNTTNNNTTINNNSANNTPPPTTLHNNINNQSQQQTQQQQQQSNNKQILIRTNTSNQLYHNGLIVFFEDIRRWFVFGLRLTSPPPKSIIPPQLSPKNDSKKTSAQPIVPPPSEPATDENPPEKIFVLDLLRQFPLSSGVSTITIDDKRSLLVIGQIDGLISLWDLKAMMLLTIPTRHRSSITSICLTKSKSCHFLVSGDSDGILCFHKLHLSCSSSSPLSSQSSLLSSSYVDNPATNPLIQAELIDFRVDFTRDSIVKIWSMDGGNASVSLVIVQIASGKLVVYDADGAELLGRMSLTSGILGLKLEYTLSKREDCIISNIPLSLSSTSNSPRPSINSLSSSPPIKSQYQQWNERIAIGSTCQNGFCGFFFRSNQSAVLSSYSVNKLLSFYFPGISSLNKQSYHGKTLTSIILYHLLSPSQRMNSKITIASLNLPSNEMSGDENGKNNNESEKLPMSKLSSKRGLSTSQSNQKLTVERLNQLNQSNNFWNVPLVPSIIEYSSSWQVSSVKQFERSVKTSQIERFNRKNSVLGGLKHLAGCLKEDK